MLSHITLPGNSCNWTRSVGKDLDLFLSFSNDMLSDNNSKMLVLKLLIWYLIWYSTRLYSQSQNPKRERILIDIYVPCRLTAWSNKLTVCDVKHLRQKLFTLKDLSVRNWLPARLSAQRSDSCFTGRSKICNLKAYASDVMDIETFPL